MLKGTLTYRDEFFPEDIVMTAYAKDNGVLNIHLEYEGNSLIAEEKVLTLFDSTLSDDDQMAAPITFGDKERRLNIKKANKIQTNIPNTLFATRVAAVLRYCEERGVREGQLEQDTGGEVTYSSEFKFTVDDPNIPLAEYKKKLGYINGINLKSKYVDIYLEEIDESLLDRQLFKAFKQKDKWGNILSKTPIRNIGFKFTELTLGFPYSQPKQENTGVSAMYGLYSSLAEVAEAHPDKNYAWIKGAKYEIVTDETLDEVMKKYWDYDGVIAIDTETSGLNINFLSRTGQGDQLVGICLSCEEGTGHYFPVQMKYITNLCGGDHWFFMDKYMRKFLEEKKFVVHNLSFDWKVFYIYGINLNAVFDTMLAYGVTERYKEPQFKYGLKELTLNLFGIDMLELSDMVVGGKWTGDEFGFWDLPYELVQGYAPADADWTLTLYHYVLKIRLLESFKAEAVFNIELIFAKVVAYSEFYGYHIDIDHLPDLMQSIEEGKEKTQKIMFEMAGEEFNPNSAKALGHVMFDVLGMPDVSGKRSTDKNAMKELRAIEDENGVAKYPFAYILKSYKDQETLYKNFIKRKDEFLSPEGYIFPHVFTFGTDTGRCSVSNPNYQSYSDTVKKFVQPRLGYKMWDSDFSQIEYRVLCSMAHEQNLIDAFADPDMDYHTHQAARMFGVSYGAVTKAMRQQSKGINFGLPYGMGDASLGARIYGSKSPENTRKAAKLREIYFEGQDNIRNFFDTVRDEGVKNGYTRTLFGRLRYYQKSTYSENQIRRQAGNHVIQGCLIGTSVIQTKEYGMTYIQDVVNQHLHVWDGEQWTEGDITYSGLKQKCIVRFECGLTFTCSPIHKFLVRDKDGSEHFVECKDLIGQTQDLLAAHNVVINRKFEHSVRDREKQWREHTDKIKNNEGYAEYLKEYPYLRSAGEYRAACEGVLENIAEEGLFANPESLIDLYQDTTMLKEFICSCAINSMTMRDGCLEFLALRDEGEATFEPVCLFLQKALLFFGVRSDCMISNEGWSVQIWYEDTEKFWNAFDVPAVESYDEGMNTSFESYTATTDSLMLTLRKSVTTGEKQDLPATHSSAEGCLQVMSVEITDEQIEMYDVCNTERGYYVADGVITHNTAADLYKLACVRVFEMLERKGWLGKVLLNAFIHDEILGEVSEEINYHEFIEEWRKAFEVPVEGFCKLYAGLGIGNSWYEAKKADWSPQFIDRLIHSERREHWNGNGQEFIEWAKKEEYVYETDRVVDYIKENISKNEQGVLTEHDIIIKPIIDTFLKSKVDDYLMQNIDNADEIARINSIVETPLKIGEKKVSETDKMIAEILGEKVKANTRFIKVNDLQDYLRIFCILHDLDYAKLDIKSPDAVKQEAPVEQEEVKVNLEEMTQDEFLMHSVRDFGFMLDAYSNRLVVNLDMFAVMGTANKFAELFAKPSGTYRLCGISFANGNPAVVETPSYVMSCDIILMQQFLRDNFNNYSKVIAQSQ